MTPKKPLPQPTAMAFPSPVTDPPAIYHNGMVSYPSQTYVESAASIPHPQIIAGEGLISAHHPDGTQVLTVDPTQLAKQTLDLHALKAEIVHEVLTSEGGEAEVTHIAAMVIEHLTHQDGKKVAPSVAALQIEVAQLKEQVKDLTALVESQQQLIQSLHISLAKLQTQMKEHIHSISANSLSLQINGMYVPLQGSQITDKAYNL